MNETKDLVVDELELQIEAVRKVMLDQLMIIRSMRSCWCGEAEETVEAIAANENASAIECLKRLKDITGKDDREENIFTEINGRITIRGDLIR